MSHVKIQTEHAPAAIGPYSQAVQAGGTVYVSGQLPINPATGEFAGADIRAQARQSLENIKAILAAAGADMAHVVKTTVLLQDMADFSAFNEVYGEYFTSKPARSCVAAKALPKGALAEVELIAEI